MRKYKIAHFSKENERAIFRENDGCKQWLTPQKTRSNNKERAVRFLHEQDCVSALSIIKFSKGLKTDEEYIEEKKEEARIKQSWGELSS